MRCGKMKYAAVTNTKKKTKANELNNKGRPRNLPCAQRAARSRKPKAAPEDLAGRIEPAQRGLPGAGTPQACSAPAMRFFWNTMITP